MKVSRSELAALLTAEPRAVTHSVNGIHFHGGNTFGTAQDNAYRAKLDEIHAAALEIQRKREGRS